MYSLNRKPIRFTTSSTEFNRYYILIQSNAIISDYHNVRCCKCERRIYYIRSSVATSYILFTLIHNLLSALRVIFFFFLADVIFWNLFFTKTSFTSDKERLDE